MPSSGFEPTVSMSKQQGLRLRPIGHRAGSLYTDLPLITYHDMKTHWGVEV
jgi:hypothetical protein